MNRLRQSLRQASETAAHVIRPTPQSSAMRRLAVGMAFLFGTCVLATLGYVLAGWTWIDAIYMVTITIFGVGYGEVRPVSDPTLKIFTVGVIIAGCSSGIYVIGGILQMVTEGEIKRLMGHHSRGREIEKLRDHVIVCGYGRVGQMLAKQLQSDLTPLVVVDRESSRVEHALEDGFLAHCGDAVDDETLLQVGIHRAGSLATVLPDDAINVFITLTARDLNERVQIIARAESPSTERKLLRSGADRVVMPAAIGAVRIAQLVQTGGCGQDFSKPGETVQVESRPEADDETAEQRILDDIDAIKHDPLLSGAGSSGAGSGTVDIPTGV